MSPLLKRNGKLVKLNGKLVVLSGGAPPPTGISGCVLHLKFNDNANDSSINAYNFTPAAGMTYDTGKLNNCAVADEYRSFAYSLSPYPKFAMDSTGTRSYEFWVKMTTTNVGAIYGEYITIGGLFFDPHIVFNINASRILEIIDTNKSIRVSNSGAFVVGDWYHIVITYDNATVTLYVNSAYIADDSGGTYTNADYMAWIHPGVANNPVIYIDNFRIFNKVLSQTEINTLYNAGAGLEDGIEYA